MVTWKVTVDWVNLYLVLLVSKIAIPGNNANTLEGFTQPHV